MWTAPASTTLSGQGSLLVFVGHEKLKGGEDIGVQAELAVCAPTCTVVANASWSGTSTGGFVAATLDLGSVDVTLVPGARLRLRLYAPDDVSDKDIALAYDTVDFASLLTIG